MSSRESRAASATPLYPLDPAWVEVVFAPFHDPELAAGLDMAYELRSARRGRLERFWCYTVAHWEDARAGTAAAELTVRVSVEVGSYDTLLYCLALPEDATVELELMADGAWFPVGGRSTGTGERIEIALSLPPCRRLEGARLRFSGPDAAAHSANLSWMGLSKAALAAELQASRRRYDPAWQGLIASESEWGEPRFARGLIFGADELESLRVKWRLPAWRAHVSRLEAMASSYLRREPEQDLHDYLPTNDVRYVRAREMGSSMYCWESVVLAFVGLIHGDPPAIRHALRYLMCAIHTQSWACSAEHRLPGSSWDMRCFHEAMSVSAVSLVADWLDFALTPRARGLVLQSLWDKGLAMVERDMMKHAYLYSCNQGPWFAGSRVFGGLMLETAWPRMGAYVDRAYQDMLTALDGYIQADAGLDEGIGYYGQTMQAVIPAAVAYARSRALDPADFLRARVLPSDRYLEAMAGVRPGSAIPEGDCRIDLFCGDVIPIMAGFFPGSVSARILAPCLEAGSVIQVSGGLTGSGGIHGFVFGPRDIPPAAPVVPVFSRLPASGFLSSYRRVEGSPRGGGERSMRVHVTGSKAAPSHSHLDKSSFVLELDGEVTLLDRGMLPYSHAEANLLKRTCMHNCMTPVLPGGGYADQVSPSAPVIPDGAGDERVFRAVIDAGVVWKELLSRYSRRLESDSIEELVVTDEGELIEPGRVALHLHSPYPFEAGDGGVELRAGRMSLWIEASWAEDRDARLDSVDLKLRPISHLVLTSAVTRSFRLVTRITRPDGDGAIGRGASRRR